MRSHTKDLDSLSRHSVLPCRRSVRRTPPQQVRKNLGRPRESLPRQSLRQMDGTFAGFSRKPVASRMVSCARASHEFSKPHGLKPGAQVVVGFMKHGTNPRPAHAFHEILLFRSAGSPNSVPRSGQAKPGSGNVQFRPKQHACVVTGSKLQSSNRNISTLVSSPPPQGR